jgi:hypothetical protein
VQLLWVIAGNSFEQKGFLSDYSPIEEKPSYRRFRLTSRICPNHHGSYKVSVLGRIRLKPAYSDNDYIPFDNLLALSTAGQVINSNYNNDMQTASAKDTFLQEVIAKENEYKRVQNGQPVEFYQPLSAGAIKNII